MKTYIWVILLASACYICASGEALANDDELTIKLPKSGIAVVIPNWNARIVSTPHGFIATAFPLRRNPTAGIHYGLSLEISEYPAEIHAQTFPEAKSGENNINRRYSVTTVIKAEYETYIVRDVVITKELIVRYVAKIKNDMIDASQHIAELKAMAAALAKTTSTRS